LISKAPPSTIRNPIARTSHLVVGFQLHVESPPSSPPRSVLVSNWDPRCNCINNSVAHVSELIPEAVDLALGAIDVTPAHTPGPFVLLLAFPSPKGRQRVHCHCRWRHWLCCHCSSCLFLFSRLQGLFSCPVPIFWIVSHDIGRMRYKVSSTRQCHILVASYETSRH